ncbi:MAG: DUF1329 domain-containing protein [Gammaproteobacteria bacterium]|nr:DUF1329 domain-containing protein [Gammaproteobacteria bacterium]
MKKLEGEEMRLIFRVLLTLALLIAAPAFAAEVPAGTILNAANLEELRNETLEGHKIGDMLTQATETMIRDLSLEMRLGPYVTVKKPQSMLDKTALYADDVTYDPSTRLISGYTSGIPFPELDEKDPDVAMKIIWNSFYSSILFVDSFQITAGTYVIDAEDGLERTNVIINNQLRMNHRTSLPPEVIGDGSIKNKIMLINIAPYDVAGTGALIQRYDDGRNDDSWAYIKSVRRIRRLSGNTWQDPIPTTDINNEDSGCLDIWPTWYPKYEFVEKRHVLLPTTNAAWTGQMPAEKLFKFDEYPHWNPDTHTDWQPREVWVINAVAPEGGTYGRKLLYYDPELVGSYFCEMFDKKDEFWRTFILATRQTKMADGDDGFIVGWQVAVDFQRLHGTAFTLDYAVQNDARVPVSDWNEDMLKRNKEFSEAALKRKYGESM